MKKEKLYYEDHSGMVRGYVYPKLEENALYINYRQLLRIGARIRLPEIRFCTNREVIYQKDNMTPWWDCEQLQDINGWQQYNDQNGLYLFCHNRQLCLNSKN